MEIEEYERPQARRAKQKEEGFIRALENKRKKKSHVGVDLPAGAASGFVSVKDLIVKQTKKRKQPEEFDPDGGVDDDTDKEIEEGLRSLRRTVSTPVGAKKSQKRRTDSVRSEGVAQKASKAKVTAPRKKNKKLAVPDGKELPRVVEDDSDDVDIERGLTTFNTALKAFSLPAQRVQSRTSPVPSRKIAVDRSFIDLDPSDGVRSSPASDSGSPRRKILTTPDKRHLPTSLRPSKSRSTSASRSRSPEPSPTAEDMPPSSPAGPSTPASHRERSASHEHDDISWLLEDSEDEAVVNAPAPLRSPQRPNGPGFTSNMSPKRSKAVKGDMAPPDIPARISGRPEIESPVPFESSLPLRAAGKRRAKVLESPGLLGSSPSEMPPPSQRRLRRLPSQSPEAPKAKRKKRKVQDTAELAKINPWVEVEADHSGDEVSEGSSLDDFLVESEGDRQFLEEADETQASPSYQQTQIYRESLLSQAPNRAGGPLFANRPARRGALGIAGGRSSRRVQGVSSSPPQEPGSEDEYEFGTFVVEDDAEISYAGSSEL
ncbi:hypothetical protein PUNSTDRAFT_48531 [Punctularia strigosozonata HHB-11173 SS5]|uniref:uncharacterized protein n=1 Tax=Punctularia strigosozonata (strain HHB-11173) TaxID=741275 RepID=UPI00044171FD|nr:uncharacterized protein PUNSTDRAFT_48531 [Punctularia strigosozonata HHB-11173 SS5]EIN13582.1 hypothetical protein PUNSTDRAFT_48531 [Punctularia strigosozonata HHB-11173 SS5]